MKRIFAMKAIYKSIITIVLLNVFSLGFLFVQETKVFASELYVSSTSQYGTTYFISSSGNYRFTITAGAWSPWYGGSPDDQGWKTALGIYKNRPIEYEPDPDYPGKWRPLAPDFFVGYGDYQSTREEAEAIGIGDFVDITLAEDDYLVFLTPDHMGWYFENRGGLYLSIVQAQDDDIPPTITSGTIFIDGTEFSTDDLVSHDVSGPYVVTVYATDNIGISSLILNYCMNCADVPDYIQIPMAAIGGDFYRGEIPGQPFETSILYYVTAYDSAGNFSHHEHPWNDPFNLSILPIITEPTISIGGEEYPLSDEDITISNNEGPYTVSAHVYTATGVDSVFLNYCANCLDESESVRISMTHVGNDYYMADIPEQPYGTTIHLYIEATCGVGHAEIREKTNNDPFLIKLVCGVPEGQTLQIIDVKGYGRCGEGKTEVKNPLWGIFGEKPDGILVANSGEKLKIECVETNPPSFRLFYAPPGSDFSNTSPKCEDSKSICTIGMCPFEGGANSLHIFHSGDNDSDDKPDCFIRTIWTSRDYGHYNDKVDNPWTGENDYWENKLDWAKMMFEMNTKNLIKLDYKYNYSDDIRLAAELLIPYSKVFPPLTEGFFESLPLPFVPEGDLVEITEIDPPIGPETEAFFNSVAENIIPIGYMIEEPTTFCDFDRDGRCDGTDLQFFQNALDKCIEDDGYHPAADIDGNGCVELADYHFLFDSDKDVDGYPNKSDNCYNSNLSPNVIIDDCQTGVTNHLLDDGCTISDQIEECADGVLNHGEFVSCVSHLTNNLKRNEHITGQEKGVIQRCVAKADIP